jgi:hypothetical protein
MLCLRGSAAERSHGDTEYGIVAVAALYLYLLYVWSTYVLYLYASFLQPLQARDSRARPSSRSCSEWTMKHLGALESLQSVLVGVPCAVPEGENHMRGCVADRDRTPIQFPPFYQFNSPAFQRCFSPPSRISTLHYGHLRREPMWPYRIAFVSILILSCPWPLMHVR